MCVITHLIYNRNSTWKISKVKWIFLSWDAELVEKFALFLGGGEEKSS